MSAHKLGYPSLVDVRYRQAGVWLWPWECFIHDNGGNGSLMAIRDSRVFYFLNNKDKRFLYEWF